MPTPNTTSPPSATHLVAAAVACESDLARYSKSAIERADGLEGLTTIKGLGSSSIENFPDAGFTTIDDVAAVTVDDLVSISGIGRTTAERVAEELDGYGDESATRCCFCGVVAEGRPLSEVRSKWFTDDDLIRYETGHVCAACAFCMDQSNLKRPYPMNVACRQERSGIGWYASTSTGTPMQSAGKAEEAALRKRLMTCWMHS